MFGQVWLIRIVTILLAASVVNSQWGTFSSMSFHNDQYSTNVTKWYWTWKLKQNIARRIHRALNRRWRMARSRWDRVVASLNSIVNQDTTLWEKLLPRVWESNGPQNHLSALVILFYEAWWMVERIRFLTKIFVVA